MAKIAGCGGHGFNTAGKRTPPMPDTGKAIMEWDFNHPTSRFLKEELERDGHKFLHTSDTAADTSIGVRTKKANDWGADVYASVHFNAENEIFDKLVEGIETLYCKGSVEGKRLAECIQTEMIKATGLRDRGVKARTDLGILSQTKMPAVIVECGFMDNVKEANLMLNVAYQRRCAEAIANGINKYLGVDDKPKNTTPAGHIMINLLGRHLTVPGGNENGSTYLLINKQKVDVRDLFEGMKLTVGWNELTSEVIIK